LHGIVPLAATLCKRFASALQTLCKHFERTRKSCLRIQIFALFCTLYFHAHFPFPFSTTCEFMTEFASILAHHREPFAFVVPFNPAQDLLFQLDLTQNNTALTTEIIADADTMTRYLEHELRRTNTRYAIGGYDEHRTIYDRSEHFDTDGDEPRRLHLGIDIWGAAGTPVFAPLAGEVHSFRNNAAFGDYGGTIILKHVLGERGALGALEKLEFHTLYGHLSAASLDGLHEGKTIPQGSQIGALGEPHENGGWSPHLHFQVVLAMETMRGDYPGVCRLSERERYLANCPNPDAILGLNQFVAL
jgi:peptidoglycan LD-endopeptidase LytH